MDVGKGDLDRIRLSDRDIVGCGVCERDGIGDSGRGVLVPSAAISGAAAKTLCDFALSIAIWLDVGWLYPAAAALPSVVPP